jgi:CHAD domain-containing protein
MVKTKANEHFTDYYTGLQLVFAYYFENTTINFGIEDLHKLRVEIKKQRAFYRFLDELPGGIFNKSEHFKILASIFKPGGRLRETHVNQSLINLYRSYTLYGFKQFLVGKNSKQTKKLARALRRFDLVEFKELNDELTGLLETVDFEIVTSRSLAFIKSELYAIKSLRPQIASDKDLHQIRTHTKALGYIAKFLNELTPSQQLADLLILSKPAEKLIGNWHDRVVLRISLETYLQKNPDAPDANEVRKLIIQINKRNQYSVKTIANRLDGMLAIDFRH